MPRKFKTTKKPDLFTLSPAEVDTIVKEASPLDRFPVPQPEFHAGFPHQLALAFGRGSQSNPLRPALPSEVILLIFKFCGFSRPARHMSSRWDFTEDEKKVRSSDANVIRAACFVLPECDRTMRTHMSRLQIITNSRDQGWVSDPEAGAWSWFELCILRLKPHESTGEIHWVQKCDEDGEKLTWVSHHNKLADRDYHWRKGKVFGPNEAVWKWLEDGERLCVLMCARFGGWSNNVRGGEVRIWEWFAPSEESEQLYLKWIREGGTVEEGTVVEY